MRYVLSELCIKTPQGFRCDWCKRNFRRGVKVWRLVGKEKDLRFCEKCGNDRVEKRVKQLNRDSETPWIFDSRFYKS